MIVCYRAVDLTIDCLRSIAPQIEEVPGTRVAICENGTGEDAAKQLRNAVEENGWQEWVEITEIYPNRGFSGGNNAILNQVVAQEKKPDFVLLLNADTIIRPVALKALIASAERFPEAGVIGPRLEWPDGEPQRSCFLDFAPVHEFITAASSGPITKLFSRGHGSLPVSAEPCEAEWVSFACALIRGEVLERCGVLDEGYYLYFDDADYCRRVRLAGWKVIYDPSARVVHLRGKSNPLKTLSQQRKRRPRYWYESRSHYYAKFYGRSHLWLANMMWSGGRVISLTRELLGKQDTPICEAEWRDIWINFWSPLRTSKSSENPNCKLP